MTWGEEGSVRHVDTPRPRPATHRRLLLSIAALLLGAAILGASAGAAGDRAAAAHSQIHRQALQAARRAVFAMRENEEIGDDAFHSVEEELDWLEMASVREEA